MVFLFLISSNVFLCSYISRLDKKIESQNEKIKSTKQSLEVLESQVGYLMIKRINEFLYNREDSAGLNY